MEIYVAIQFINVSRLFLTNSVSTSYHFCVAGYLFFQKKDKRANPVALNGNEMKKKQADVDGRMVIFFMFQSKLGLCAFL